MSPLEQYQQDRRSGLFETTTEAEPVPATKPMSEAAHDVVNDEVLKVGQSAAKTVKAIYKDVQELEERVQSMDRWIMALGAIALIAVAGAILAIFLLLKDTPIQVQREQPVKTKIVTQTKVQKLKVMVANGDDKWRRKACYLYRDWQACLAYKSDLPSVVRVGRDDLN